MHEFETFVYLDLQKTGSTFIMHLLRRFSSERELINNPHASVGKRYDAHKFHFISVRNPVDQYLSLYAFGCGGVGTLYNKMRKAGYDHLYNGTWAGFRNWIDLILDPENRRFLVAENREYEARSEERRVGKECSSRWSP